MSLKKFIKTHSVQTTIIAFIVSFAIITAALATSISDSFMSRHIMNRYINDYLDTTYTNCDNNLSMMMSQLNLLAVNISTWQDLSMKVTDKYATQKEKQAFVSANMPKLLENYTLVDGIDIITDSGTYRCSKSPLLFDVPLSMTMDIKNASLTFYPGTLKSDSDNYIAIGTKYYNFFNVNDYGYLILYFNEEKLHSTYKNFIPENADFFITSDNIIISHSNKNELGARAYVPDEYYQGDNLSANALGDSIVKKFSFNTGHTTSSLTLVTIMQVNSLYGIAYTINKYITISLVATLLMALCLTYFITRKLLKQYMQLKNKIVDFGNNPYSDVTFTSSYEIKALEDSFEKMTKQITQLINENDIAYENQRIAELNALQSQINPHFIYNALDIITCMAKLRNEKDIEQITYALASYFRLGLNKGQNKLLIADELKHVQSYIYIESIRHPDTFEIEYDIPETLAKENYIVKIVLQPLVENCIKHGFRGITYKGKIRIYAYFNGNDIFIEVWDNGVGLRGSKSAEPQEFSSQYGLKNIQQRLELEYGSGYGLSIRDNPDGGTIVQIKIKKTNI